MRRTRFSCFLGLVASVVAMATAARADMLSDRPLADRQTINALITQHSGDEFHIVLVHGIRTADRTTWDGFRAQLCKHLTKPHRCTVVGPATRKSERLILRTETPAADFLGHPIWATPEQWRFSEPFVDHYAYALEDGTRLVLDEVNWWTLALALKCQFLVGDDTNLVGANDENITNCTSAPADGLHFGWFDANRAEQLRHVQPPSGGAPYINRLLKTEVLDWGIADAVLSLGTMKTFLRETIRCSFDDILLPQQRSYLGGDGDLGTYDCQKAAPQMADARGAHKSFVIASHSLGAFLLLDTFAAAAADAADSGQAGEPCTDLVIRSGTKLAAAKSVSAEATHSRRLDQSLCVALSASSDLFFLANQFSLLELGRVQGLDSSAEHPDAVSNALGIWARSKAAGDPPPQVLAFSDPGDILTYQFPQIPPAKVYNAYPQNDFRWFGFFEWPPTAHTKYLISEPVLDVMFGP